VECDFSPGRERDPGVRLDDPSKGVDEEGRK
jgi:hypothetical protein